MTHGVRNSYWAAFTGAEPGVAVMPAVAAALRTRPELQRLRVVDLRAELWALGLPTDGGKAALVARLWETGLAGAEKNRETCSACVSAGRAWQVGQHPIVTPVRGRAKANTCRTNV
jgi:hypothetical protein